MNTYILKHALRNLSRMRTYTFINVMGLIVSLTGAIVIARYVHQELTVNHYVPELDRTYLLVNHGGYEGNIYYSHDDAINANHIDNWEDPFADPDVECFTRFTFAYGGLDMVADDVHYQVEAVLADSMFLRMLPRELVAGTLSMKGMTDVVITRDLAERIWPDESAVGKTLVHDDKSLSVVGVVERPDTKCSFGFDMLLNIDLKKIMYVGWSVVRLREGADYKEYNRRQKPYEEDFGQNMEKFVRHYQLFPLDNVYLDSPVNDLTSGADNFYPRGDKQNIMFLVGGALLLLLVGLFNYFNIFSILAVHRHRGIAIRKIFGANTSDVFWMIFVENFLLAAFSVAMAWIVVSLGSPLLVKYYGVTLQASPCFDILMSLSIALVLPLAVSIPVAVRSCHQGSGGDVKRGAVNAVSRKVSLWLQYAFTFFLIVVSSYSVRQLYYMLHSDLGYKTEHIVWFDLIPAIRNQSHGYMTHEEWLRHVEMTEKAEGRADDYMRRIKESPLFTHCVYGGETPSLTSKKRSLDNIGMGLKADIKGSDYQSVVGLWLSPGEIEMYGLKLLEGEKPDAERDNLKSYRMYLSRSAKEKLGVHDISSTRIQPERRLWFGVDENGNPTTGNPAYTIAGVYDDFCVNHLGMEDVPFFLMIENPRFSPERYFIASYQPGKRKEAMAFLQKLYEEENGSGSIIPHKYIEDEIEKIYAEDARVARIFTTFAILSILISCFGLLGISLYDVRQRRREIAIRKVNGARFKDIFRLIARRYLSALGAAIVIGTPLAIYALHFYMQSYAHHVPLTPWYFIGAALLMFLLTLATIYWQIRKAASENPADVMKSE